MPRSKSPSPNPIRIEYPSLDDAPFEGNPVLRGVISRASLFDLRIDSAYQREFLSASTRRFIMDALINHERLPDIELGMRGENWSFDETGQDVVLLHDPVFIIDGQQRRGTTTEYIRENSTAPVRQGALIHFNTTMEWERKRFHALNLHQTRVAASVLLKNLRSTNTGIATLYGLSVAEQDFPLRGRVGWTQAQTRKDLVTAAVFTRMTLLLHGHIGSGIVGSTVHGIDNGYKRLAEIVGLPTLRQNTKTYWNSIEEIWGITSVSRTGAAWLKSSFLMAYTNILSDHQDFWIKNTLTIDRDYINKLKRFPINDPEIKALAGASGVAYKTLQFHLIQHLNKGRQKLLNQRPDTALEHRTQALKLVHDSKLAEPTPLAAKDLE
jgi:hypothetical protein